MRKQPFFHPRQHDQRKLQPLSRVQRHQRDLRVLIILIRIADQSGVIEKLIKRLAAIARVHRRIHQFT